jgi:ABC-type Fe3+-hydroxamate transport system substrate-binding protein
MKKEIERPRIAFPEIDDVTRREFLIGAGLIALDPACGRSGEEDAFGSSETRAIEHALGTTRVPTEPRRVVSLTGSSDMDALLALSFEPVTAGANYPAGDGNHRFECWLELSEREERR